MPLINLHGPTVDKLGRYVDAGADLLVGDAVDDDVTTERGDALVEMGRAVEVTDEPAPELPADD